MNLLVLALVECLALQALALPASIDGRRIIVNGEPFHIKGINWNPIAIGGLNPGGVDFPSNVLPDAGLMAQAGINAIRTYLPITDTAVLDVLWNHSIQVLNTVYASGYEPVDAIGPMVDSVKHHPAILMWVVGNEWNYNNCYSNLNFQDCAQKLQTVAGIIKNHDSLHPVASVYGEAPPASIVQEIGNIDVWGTNVYDMLSFNNLFQRWASTSTKPLFIGEYGADAYNTHTNQEDQDSQAFATQVLTQQIYDNSALYDGGICSGGLIFELADEWWKFARGSPSIQENGGVAPGGGPYPDGTFNEEWWGLFDIQRTARQAYYKYASMAVPQPRRASELLDSGVAAVDGVKKSCTAGGCSILPAGLRV